MGPFTKRIQTHEALTLRAAIVHPTKRLICQVLSALAKAAEWPKALRWWEEMAEVDEQSGNTLNLGKQHIYCI